MKKKRKRTKEKENVGERSEEIRKEKKIIEENIKMGELLD